VSTDREGDELRLISHFCHIVEKLQYDSACSQDPTRRASVPVSCSRGTWSRQVGKTTLALSLTGEGRMSPLYLDLELPSDRAKLADPEL
jgi:hypothetical protein